MKEQRKTYTRRLNRTLLKKTGTKNAYLTDKKFLSFFGFDDINQLVSTQNDTNRITFYLKNTQNTRLNYSFKDNEYIDMHIVKATNEVRLSGNDFSNMLENHGITETDAIIINRIKTEDGQIKHFMSFSIAKDTIVFQPSNQETNKYWAWDNCDNIEMWSDKTEFISNIYEDGHVSKKILRFNLLGNEEIPMAARGTSQIKKLFSIEEKNNNQWYAASLFPKFRALEIVRDGDELSIYKRENLISEIIESEVFI